jgi:hypothetical protein
MEEEEVVELIPLRWKNQINQGKQEGLLGLGTHRMEVLEAPGSKPLIQAKAANRNKTYQTSPRERGGRNQKNPPLGSHQVEDRKIL